MVGAGPVQPARRTLLSALACAMMAAGGSWARPTANTPDRRIAAIDWAMAETAVALGHPPVAVAELTQFRPTAPDPLPTDTTDLGLRGAPNLEALTLIAPDLILSSNYYTFVQPRLEQIAPVLAPTLFVPGENPFPKVMAALRTLAERLDDPQSGIRAQDIAQNRLAALARDLAPHRDRPLCLINLGDARHLRVFGHDSLFDGTLRRLGLSNAWTSATAFGFNAPVPMERLIAYPDATLIVIGDIPPQARRSLATGALWNSLPPVRAGRVRFLPDIHPFGGIPSALVFADRLARALQAAA
ncbi:MAG TPA: iron-siderophore ABC transporter substrate-binding protein [Paenirhodobacter sp.]